MSKRKVGNEDGHSETSGTEPMLCAVCADVATGNHYSVPSCNGCKTFFRRAMVNERNFVCEGNGDCPVSKGVRCACRACRLAKCLSVGMNPESIQSERDRIGYTKRVRKETASTSATAASASVEDDSDMETNVGRISPLSDIPTLENLTGPSSSRRHSMRYAAVLDRLTQLENSITLLLINDYGHFYRSLDEALEAPSYFLRPLPVHAEDSVPLRESFLTHIAASNKGMALWRPNVVALYIDWAKMFAVFRKLPKSDKIALLTNHFGSYIIMCEVRDIIEPSTSSRTSEAVVPSTSKAPESDAAAAPVQPQEHVGYSDNTLVDLVPLVKIIEEYVTRPFESLGLSTSEFAALQAITFFDPDADNLDAASQRNVSAEQKKYVDALNEYLNDHYSPAEAGRRFGAIILRVSTIRKIAAKKKDSLKLLNVFNLVGIDDLVKEMALGQSSE